MKICIDPGHGGHDPGAIGPTGLKEKVVALYVAQELSDLFELEGCGIETYLTRFDDEFVSLQGRCDAANQNGADLFISIHCNSFHKPQASGFEVWTSVGWTPADKYASHVFQKIRSYFPFKRGRVDMSDGDEDKEAQFKVLRGTKMPAILVELSFISNPYEEHEMKDPEWRDTMARAIYEGVCSARF